MIARATDAGAVRRVVIVDAGCRSAGDGGRPGPSVHDAPDVPDGRSARPDAGAWSLLGIRMSSAPAEAIADACVAARPIGTPPTLVACANLHSIATASRDPEFAAALAAATFVTADGAPVRAAGRLLGEPVGPRVTGHDVFERVMARLDARAGRALFVGSVPQVLERIRGRAADDYPRATVEVLSPPSRPLDCW
jgi:UDP-N-acetyl-D-mannosaminuronic acid transferase (WecB/TagA/CpsF family)